MKKVRIPLTLAAALVAGVAVGSNAFAPQPRVFVKKASAPLQSTNKADYVFKASSGLCDVKPDEICKRTWVQNTVPAENSAPSVTATITSTITPGESQLVP